MLFKNTINRFYEIVGSCFFLFHRSLTVYKCRSPGAASPFTPEELSISSFNIFISRTKFFFLPNLISYDNCRTLAVHDALFSREITAEFSVT